jgi:hypothetical protein
MSFLTTSPPNLHDDMPQVAPRRRRRLNAARRLLRWFWLLGLPFALAAVVSLGQALTRSSNLTTSERFVEWVRDHHGGSLVNSIEHWWYLHHQPKVGGTLSALPTFGKTTSSSAPGGASGPASTAAPTTTVPSWVLTPIAPSVANPLPGEGQWAPIGDLVDGKPALQVTYLRPDAIHTTLVAGVVHIDQSLVHLHLYAGRTVPGHGPWPGGSSIAPADQSSVLAAFNSGFRMQDANGGFSLAGRSDPSLRLGAASVVITSDGKATVGQWGRDVQAGPTVVAVRQNLDLIVDNGAPVSGLNDNTDNRWGKTVGNALYVWRSGLGVDAKGNLVYVAGDGLSVQSLANLLTRAGAVRGMELDINYAWVSFNVFPHNASHQLLIAQTAKLLAGMKKPSTRYLAPDDRDFFAVYPIGAGT